MILSCIGSGSSGNCYILENDRRDSALILDAGLPIKKIEEGLDWNIKKVAGVVVTHVHKDHSLSIGNLERMGIPVYAPYRGDKYITFTRNDFIVKSFPLKSKDGRWMHTNGDGSECPNYGFMIESECKRYLYITDFLATPYTFKTWGINTMLISCNHNDDVEYDNSAKEYHSILGHSSLSTVKEFIRASATDSLENIILCHLSDSADAMQMLDEVRAVSPLFANVYIAQKGSVFLV